MHCPSLHALLVALVLPCAARAECGEPFTPIFEIQGQDPSSPLRGAQVATEGVVSAALTADDALRGFFLQDPAGDADPRSSDGIFVFAPGAPVAPGDAVRVSGQVREFFGQTEIAAVESIERCGSGAIEALGVELPADSLEPLEGMLVRFETPLFVTDTYDLQRFGEVGLAAGGPLRVPTDSASGRADPAAAERENARRRILLDDGSRRVAPEDFYWADRTLRRGDRALGLTGVIEFAFGAYRVHPARAVEFDPASPRPRAPRKRRGALRVVSLNAHNYWATLDDGTNGARGADSAAELARQRAKLVAAIRALRADVVALQEVENDGGIALADLAAALDTSARRPAWRAIVGPSLAGSDVIQAAILYRFRRVRALGSPVSDVDPVFAGGRPPLAQRFHTHRGPFALIVAHLKSKDCSGARGADADAGDGQGCFNARRTRQAEALLRFVDAPWRPREESVLLVGDLNAWTEEDPVRLLRARLVHLLRSGPGPPASHSFVFEGAHGLLDHALATPELVPRVSRAGVWSINADEPRLLGYDDDVLDPGELSHELHPAGFYRRDAFRSSDHDPVVVDLVPAPARRH